LSKEFFYAFVQYRGLECRRESKKNYGVILLLWLLAAPFPSSYLAHGMRTDRELILALFPSDLDRTVDSSFDPRNPDDKEMGLATPGNVFAWTKIILVVFSGCTGLVGLVDNYWDLLPRNHMLVFLSSRAIM
tara:strand:+ start:91 stop:486 length:396 start_codon:yes stop_codon:yes gene_type:complete